MRLAAAAASSSSRRRSAAVVGAVSMARSSPAPILGPRAGRAQARVLTAARGVDMLPA